MARSARIGAESSATARSCHWRVLALVAGGYFFDVLDLTILGALVPDMVKSGFLTAPQVAAVGSATLAGLLIGCVGQGEFTDRFGRKAVYQFNLLLYGVATQCSVLSRGSGSAPSSRCVFPIPPNTRQRIFAAASSL